MTITEAARRAAFEEHVPYEIHHLVEAYKLLLEPNRHLSGLTPDMARAVEDELIVSFCTHARNLLEFFFRPKDKTKYKYALARDYANKEYEPLKKSDVEALYDQLCAQINHLTYNRTDDDDRKIGAAERKELVKIVHKEAERLGGHLRKEYDRQHLQIDRLAKAAEMPVTEKAAGVSTSLAGSHLR